MHINTITEQLLVVHMHLAVFVHLYCIIKLMMIIMTTSFNTWESYQMSWFSISMCLHYESPWITYYELITGSFEVDCMRSSAKAKMDCCNNFQGCFADQVQFLICSSCYKLVLIWYHVPGVTINICKSVYP